MVRDDAVQLVRDHQIDPDGIHKEYETIFVDRVNAIEGVVNKERKKAKATGSCNSNGSSRASSQALNSNNGRYTCVISMDPDHVDKSFSHKEASKCWFKFNGYINQCFHYGYDITQYISNLSSRLDKHWSSTLGDLERFNFIK